MQDTRTGFAIPAQPAAGQVRAFPRAVACHDEPAGDHILVRHAGRNFVFDSPEDLHLTIRATDVAQARASQVRDFVFAPTSARLHYIVAGQPAEILIGVVLGIPFAALFARCLLS